MATQTEDQGRSKFQPALAESGEVAFFTKWEAGHRGEGVRRGRSVPRGRVQPWRCGTRSPRPNRPERSVSSNIRPGPGDRAVSRTFPQTPDTPAMGTVTCTTLARPGTVKHAGAHVGVAQSHAGGELCVQQGDSAQMAPAEPTSNTDEGGPRRVSAPQPPKPLRRPAKEIWGRGKE